MNEKWGKIELTTVCVILNYNDSKTTISLLSNIQYFQELDYIVIVDNKSTDDSYEQLKQYSNEKVHLILTERNGGYGYGNNFGIWYSYNHLGATEVLIANPDVIFSAECVKALKSALLEKKDCAIVAPVMTNGMGKRDILAAWKKPTMGLSPTVPYYSEFIDIGIREMNAGTYLKDVYIDFGLLGMVVFPYILGVGTMLAYVSFRKRGSLLLLTLLSFLYVYLEMSAFMNLFRLGYYLIPLVATLAGLFLTQGIGRHAHQSVPVGVSHATGEGKALYAK